MQLYRATAECSACGKVVDVGPFDHIPQWNEGMLPGWLTTSDQWMIRDGMGAPITLCDACMGRPLRQVLVDVTERRTQEHG